MNQWCPESKNTLKLLPNKALFGILELAHKGGQFWEQRICDGPKRQARMRKELCHPFLEVLPGLVKPTDTKACYSEAARNLGKRKHCLELAIQASMQVLFQPSAPLRHLGATYGSYGDIVASTSGTCYATASFGANESTTLKRCQNQNPKKNTNGKAGSLDAPPCCYPSRVHLIGWKWLPICPTPKRSHFLANHVKMSTCSGDLHVFSTGMVRTNMWLQCAKWKAIVGPARAKHRRETGQKKRKRCRWIFFPWQTCLHNMLLKGSPRHVLSMRRSKVNWACKCTLLPMLSGDSSIVRLMCFTFSLNLDGKLSVAHRWKLVASNFPAVGHQSATSSQSDSGRFFHVNVNKQQVCRNGWYAKVHFAPPRNLHWR